MTKVFGLKVQDLFNAELEQFCVRCGLPYLVDSYNVEMICSLENSYAGMKIVFSFFLSLYMWCDLPVFLVAYHTIVCLDKQVSPLYLASKPYQCFTLNADCAI